GCAFAPARMSMSTTAASLRCAAQWSAVVPSASAALTLAPRSSAARTEAAFPLFTASMSALPVPPAAPLRRVAPSTSTAIKHHRARRFENLNRPHRSRTNAWLSLDRPLERQRFGNHSEAAAAVHEAIEMHAHAVRESQVKVRERRLVGIPEVIPTFYAADA